MQRAGVDADVLPLPVRACAVAKEGQRFGASNEPVLIISVSRPLACFVVYVWRLVCDLILGVLPKPGLSMKKGRL